MEKIKYKCCATVFYGTLMHRKDCGKTAKFERDGKHYCGTHDPVAVAARNKQRDAEFKKRWEAERQASATKAAAAAEQKRRADCYDELLNSLNDLNSLYVRAWDQPAGSLWFSPESVQKFEEIHARATAVIAKATGASHE